MTSSDAICRVSRTERWRLFEYFYRNINAMQQIPRFQHFPAIFICPKKSRIHSSILCLHFATVTFLQRRTCWILDAFERLLLFLLKFSAHRNAAVIDLCWSAVWSYFFKRTFMVILILFFCQCFVQKGIKVMLYETCCGT